MTTILRRLRRRLGVPPALSQHERRLDYPLWHERLAALMRLAVCLLVTTVFAINLYHMDSPGSWLLLCIGYVAFSTLIVARSWAHGQHSLRWRNAISIADVSGISFLIVATGEPGLPLFFLYLWITLANGFRFGPAALFASTAFSVAGLCAALVLSRLWQSQPALSAGALATLILIPGFVAHIVRQLHRARRRAQEASAAKARFLAHMSHDLRVPLNAILGANELLASNERLAPEERSQLNVIRESIKLSLHQIDNVLDLSKIESGKLAIEKTELDLHDVLNGTIRLVRGVAHEKNLRLMLRIDPAVPYRLVGDPRHLQEILFNLLSHSVRFTAKGYVSLDVDVVATDERTALLRFAIHDTGAGIDAQALERIFDAFSQDDAESIPTTHTGGSGLGMAIAKQLVDLMDGRIAVRSEKDGGTTFSTEIRFARGPRPPDGDARLGGMRVLLISERSALRQHASTSTENWGVSLRVVATAAEATTLLGRSIRLGNPFHAVLVDSGTALTDAGAHRSDNIVDKAWACSAPPILICDVSPGEEQLRQWGYACVLPYNTVSATLFDALRASGFQSTQPEQGVVRVEPWAWGRPTHRHARLLVADDNRTNLMILRKVLETSNYDVDTVDSGEQALEKLLAGRYKAAILDMHMPTLGGLEVVRQYRLLNRGPRLPIIMLTANATIDAKVESADAGADAYLTKPATASVIVSTLEKLLNEIEVFHLARARPAIAETQVPPVLDTGVISELDRLYNDRARIADIVNEFESESRRLFDELRLATTAKNHAAFCDLLHALKGNAANVGALRFAQACGETEGSTLIDFRREGEQMLRRLEDELSEASKALRAFTAADGSDSAHGSDPAGS